MAQAWNGIKRKRIPVVLVSSNEGESQLYGYPVDEDSRGGELTEEKIARVVGVVQRPVRPEDVVERLLAADVLIEGPGAVPGGGHSSGA
jgi:hypothetical protein